MHQVRKGLKLEVAKQGRSIVKLQTEKPGVVSTRSSHHRLADVSEAWRGVRVVLYHGRSSVTVLRLEKQKCQFLEGPSRDDSNLRPEHKPSKLVLTSRRRVYSNENCAP
jgi:hypothetical protein